ncbi:MAG: hypothetical protein PQJ59_05265 [Spirochaetales bacterium]|nr:hypothetical protein [Spirochaetales bacterium]
MFDTEALYKKNYEDTLAHLEYQKERPDFDREDVAQALEALYIYEGQDWDGRGELKEAEISSSIAAYEAFLSQN